MTATAVRTAPVAVIGFEGALVVRVAWDEGLTLLLALFTLRHGLARRHRLAYREFMPSVVLSVLTAWHVAGILSVTG